MHVQKMTESYFKALGIVMNVSLPNHKIIIYLGFPIICYFGFFLLYYIQDLYISYCLTPLYVIMLMDYFLILPFRVS